MKTKVLLLTLMLTFGVWSVAQSSSSGQSASAPDPQAVPQQPAIAPAQNGSPGAAAGDNAALQSRIQDALRNEPTLGSSQVTAAVIDSRIEFSGSVGSSKDKLTAERIAQSFDGNRQLDDQLVVTGHGHSDMAPRHPAMNNGGTGNAANPSR